MFILDTVYNIFIYPLEYLINILFFYFLNINKSSPFSTLFALSLSVNLLALPIYNIAEKIQEKEKNIQALLKPKIENIKAAFKGDKRHLLIMACHRIYGYKTIYAFRGTLGLLIQIPFFIAAYNFLSHYKGFNNVSLLGIVNISKPDALLKLGNYTINILPFLMTFINIASAFVYTKKLSIKEKLPLFIMSMFFLVILYNSPALLLFYWTINCLFSLVKNIIIANLDSTKLLLNKVKNNKHIKTIYYILFSVYTLTITIMTVLYFLREHFINLALINSKYKTLVIHLKTYSDLCVIFAIMVIIFLYIKRKSILRFKILNTLMPHNNLQDNNFILMLLSCFILFLLSALFIPTSLIASSPEEFVEPLKMIISNIFKYVGIFVVYPIFIYILLPQKFKNYFSFIVLLITFMSLINTFIMTGNYGNITSDIEFENPNILASNFSDFLISISLFLFLYVIIVLLYKHRRTSIINNMVVIISLTIVTISIYNLNKINREYENFKIKQNHAIENDKYKVFNFSKTGENVLIIMFDRGIPYLYKKHLEEKPELKNRLAGFTWYYNAISFAGGTLGSTTSLFGGYDYTPYELNLTNKRMLKEAHNEALALLPLMFVSNGYESVFYDPPMVSYEWTPDLSVFNKYNGVRAYRDEKKSLNKTIDAYYLGTDINENSAEEDFSYIKKKLIGFSIFKIIPINLRSYFYKDLKFFMVEDGYFRYNSSMKEYASLISFTNRINIEEDGNYFNIFVNDVTHEPFYFNNNYKPGLEATNLTELDITYFLENFSDDIDININKDSLDFYARTYYANVVALEEMSKIFDYLRENNIYNNTKIIIVSDHGLTLGNQSKIFNVLFFVKDFNSVNNFKIENNFMTTADMPYLASKHLVYNKSPFSGIPLTNINKSNGINFVSIDGNEVGKNNTNYTINSVYKVSGNIFEASNWIRKE